MNNIHWICSGLNDADQPLISLFQGPFCHFRELSTYFFPESIISKNVKYYFSAFGLFGHWLACLWYRKVFSNLMKDQKRNHLSRIKILIWNIGIFSVTVSINTKYDSTLASGSNRHRYGWAWYFWDFGLGHGQTIVTRVRETLLCILLIWLSCWARKTINQVSKVQISFTHRGRNQSVRGWPWKSRPFEVSWRSFVFIRLLIRISSFC